LPFFALVTPFCNEVMPVSRSDEREDLLRGRFRIAELHREDHHVDLADGRGIIGRLHGGQMDRSIPFKRNAILPERLQLLAPRDERRVSPALLQARPVIAADSARTHDGDLKVRSRVPCSPQPTVTIGDGLVRQRRLICCR
jgi:hypothetical protein